MAPGARIERDAPERGPEALLPVWAARLVGFVALGSLGALEWQRLVGGLSSGRALVWVAAATVAGAAVVAAGRSRAPGRATVAAAAGGLLLAVAVSGLDLGLLRPRHWGELIDGVAGGAQALGTVRLPYAGADPWPRAALELNGSLLLTVAALLACWPRPRTRGYPFLALAAMLVLVVAPVVSLGGARPLVLGAVIAALTVCFLWLERLPLRPGIGVAALLGVALAGALPLAAVADRGEPWFDYKAFAEGLGPDDPVRFSWSQSYGPIDWPRDGNEVMRVTSDEPHYWKAVNLERFDGMTWTDAGPPPTGGADAETDIREDWRNKPGWRDQVQVSVRRMRTRDVLGAGTILDVDQATRPVRPSGEPGRWVAASELRRGDSYTVDSFTPAPTAAEVRSAEETGFRVPRADDLDITVPFRRGHRPTPRSVGGIGRERIPAAVIHFRPFGDTSAPFVTYPAVHRTRYGAVDQTMRDSLYRRTWALAKRLRARAETPFEYIVAVNGYLSRGFGYSERPEPPAPGRAPLDAFLIDSKEGYCQHFAGAMALLLRMGGVPARVATGFSPGGFSKRRDAWIVRDTDAHAWVEAWFDELGWVTFDPTPDLTPARSQIAALEPPPPPVPPSASDTAPGTGVGAGALRPGGVRPDLLFDPLRSSEDSPGGAGGAGGTPWWAWALAAVALGFVAVALVRWWRRRAVAPLSPLDRAVAELEQALRRSGRPMATGTTLRQLERSLGAEPEATGYLRALSASRYGTAPRVPTAAERRALRRALAQGLGLGGRLRALWALPPWPR